MKLTRRKLVALLVTVFGSSVLPPAVEASTRAKPLKISDLSPDVRAFAERFSRHARHWLLVDPLYRVAEQVYPQDGAGPGWHAELNGLLEECAAGERQAWLPVEIHLAEAGCWIAGELEEDRQRWARMTATDRQFIFDVLDIRNGQLQYAETLELLQMSGDDVARIATRFNRQSRGRLA